MAAKAAYSAGIPGCSVTLQHNEPGSSLPSKNSSSETASRFPSSTPAARHLSTSRRSFVGSESNKVGPDRRTTPLPPVQRLTVGDAPAAFGAAVLIMANVVSAIGAQAPALDP